MKKIRITTSIERQILIGLIMSDTYIKKIVPILEIELLEIPAARLVTKWVINYFSKFKQAPRKHIQDIFVDKSRKLKDKEAKEWIADFLDSISKEYEKSGFNEELLLARAMRYFKRQRLRSNINQIEDLLEDDEIEKAEQLWIKSRNVPSSLDLGFDPLSPKTAKILLTQEENRTSIYTGIPKLDRLTGPMKSGWLVLFMGPQKRGKTWALLCMIIAACLQGFNVVFISLESEDEDLAIRLWMMIGSLVSKLIAGENKTHLGLNFPYYTKSGQIKYKKRNRKVVNAKSVIEAIRKFNVLSPGKLIMKVFPMNTAGPDEIESYLDSLEAYNNFTPHMIGIDYLGIMKGSGSGDRKERYNDNAMFMKSLAQKRKAVVASAHQGRRETLEAFNINPDDVPEDVRILGHVDVLFGLNQTREEKEMGVYRISNLLHRHIKYTITKQVQLLQQLEAGQFALDGKIVNASEIEEEILRRE